MNMRLPLKDETTLTRLNRGLFGLCAGVALVIGWWGVTLVVVQRSHKEIADQIKRAEQEIESNSRLVAGIPEVVQTAPNVQTGINRFRTSLARLARSHEVVVVDFQGSSQVSDFSSKFEGSKPAGDWSQLSVRLQLAGRLPSIVAVLRLLPLQGIPFEFDSISFDRAAVSQNGQAVMHADLDLRVFGPKEGA